MEAPQVTPGPLPTHEGLSQAQARDRLARDGPNALPVSRPHSMLRLLRDVATEPMFLLLVACGDQAGCSPALEALRTQPAHPPVNTLPTPSRLCTHDSALP